jgi:hypothetical protein
VLARIGGLAVPPQARFRLPLRFSQRVSADHLVLELHEDERDFAMSPIVVGLTVTRCGARHRWDIRAKPRSPW